MSRSSCSKCLLEIRTCVDFQFETDNWIEGFGNQLLMLVSIPILEGSLSYCGGHCKTLKHNSDFRDCLSQVCAIHQAKFAVQMSLQSLFCNVLSLRSYNWSSYVSSFPRTMRFPLL